MNHCLWGLHGVFVYGFLEGQAFCSNLALGCRQAYLSEPTLAKEQIAFTLLIWLRLWAQGILSILLALFAQIASA